jgi:hypothetical protein
MIDISNLSTAELLELKKQVKERLNSFTGVSKYEKSIDELIEIFNQKCYDKDLCLGMKKINTENGIILQINDALDVIYESEEENEETIRFLINEHISKIRVYKYLAELDIDEYKFVQFDDRYIIIDFEYQNVDFRLREDLFLESLALSASITMSDRDVQKTLSLDGLTLRVSSEDQSSHVKVELHDSQEIVTDELQDAIETMTDKILDKSLSLSTF